MSASGKRGEAVLYRVILIDADDRHWLDNSVGIEPYGYVRVYATPKGERLHRLILKPSLGLVVDHKNGNPLDNRKKNLRVCTQAQNCRNSSPRRNNKSGVRGVWFDIPRAKWTAQITTSGERKALGRFDSFEAAVEARKRAEAQLWGEYSYDNRW